MTPTAAQKVQETARKLLAGRPLYDLINDWEETDRIAKNCPPELATVRGWILDELESRDLDAFNQWLESNDPSPRTFFVA